MLRKKPFSRLAFAGLLASFTIAAYAGPTPPRGGGRLGPSVRNGNKPDLDKDPTLYIVGYAHLDTQWLWTYPAVIGDYLKKTMEDNFALFDKYPHYTFNFTGSNRYRLMKEYYPEDYAKLKKYVAEGRWFPAGSSIEEGDVNSPSLEGIIRHVLYGNEFFQKEFGKSSTEYMLPDCFGFPAALPSILAHCGLKGFSTQKLTWGSAVGIPFNVGVWKGPDGRGVVAALNPGSYGSDVHDDLTNDTSWLDRVEQDGKDCGVYADYHYYGTGDQGGAPKESTVANVEKTLTSHGPLNVVAGDADQMFNDLTSEEIAKLPVYQGDLELTQHSAGSITSEAEMKRWNHQNEKLAEAAEEASVAAMTLGSGVYPTDQLDYAWNLFLTGQFHDMMAGTARPLAYTYEWNDESIAMNQFASAITSGVGAIAKGMDTAGPGVPLVVFNELSFDRTDPVEATVPFDARRGLTVVGPDGRAVPSQVLSSSSASSRILFMATAPSVGLAVYHARPADNGWAVGSDHWVKADGRTLESDRYRVTVDASGNVSSIYDKSDKREVLSAPIRLAFEAEAPSVYPAWNMDWKDQQKPPYAYVDGPAQIKVVESGPVRVALQITRNSQGSKFVQQVRLTAGSDRIEFNDGIDWKTTGCCLKATFPLVASNPKATYNWQVGTIQRGNNDPKKYEVASHRWFDLTDHSGNFGCTVLTGSKNGSDKPSDSTVRLTLLYSPKPTSDFAEQAYQDWGHHEILYGLYPHSGGWQSAQSYRTAYRLDQPLMVFQTAAHRGSPGFGRTFSLLSVNSDHVHTVAVKKGEYNGHIIVRVREDNGLGAADVHLRFGSGIASAIEVDGQERKIGPAKVQDGQLVFNMPPYYVKAFELVLRRPRATLAPPAAATVSLPYNLDAISSRVNPGSGNFDGHNRSIAAGQLPRGLTFESVPFRFGPETDGSKNAVACEGQTVALPAGRWQKVYFLAASSDGDRSDVFRAGRAAADLKIQYWSGHIGEWDTRVWEHPQEYVIYNWGDNPYEGLVPGYMKLAPVAYACDHRHDASGDEIYQYSYLFKYGMDLPRGATSVTLPNDPNVKVLAMSVARSADDEIWPADPLYDTLPRHLDAPVIGAAGSSNDSVKVSISPRMYGSTSTIRYSTDGGAPNQTYSGPFWVSRSETIKACVVGGPVGVVHLRVNDRTAPSTISANYWSGLNSAELRFSEPVDKSVAENPQSYHLSSGSVVSAQLSPDGQTIRLKTDGVGDSSGLTIQAQEVDLSPNHNRASLDIEPSVSAPVFQKADFLCDGAEFSQVVPNLPVKGGDPWTMNFFIKMKQLPPDHTPVIGFGRVVDDTDGAGRFICEFARGGIRFWGRNVDISTQKQFKLNDWHMITVTYNGSLVSIYQDGDLLASQNAELRDAPPVVHIAPLDGWYGTNRFTSGEVGNFTIWNSCLDADGIQALLGQKPTGADQSG